VVLHDKRPVAIKEQLYEVLCYCHAVARHGGRDKTCATLRLNYSWVPKELTAKFVKACPTCTLKRSGNPDLLSQFGQATQAAPPPYAQTVSAPEPASQFLGGPNDSPPGLSFVVESDGGDDGGGSTGFGRSMFATPDLSVYPSPTLSAGSLGPTTPSPFLPSGLFGYPTMFDPGHGSNLSSMAGWDPSSFSPCDPMYADELIPKLEEPSLSAKEIIDNCSRGMQLQLPKKVDRPLRARSRGDEYDVGCSADPLPRTESTPCPNDVDNIDPTLLMERDDGRGGQYLAAAPSAPLSPSKSGSRVLKQQQQQHPPKFGLALRATTPTMGSGMGASLSADLRMLEPASTPGPRKQQRLRQQRQRQRQLRPPSSEAPPPTKSTGACSFGGSVPEFLRSFSFPPPPPPPGGGGSGGASASTIASSASPPLPPRTGGGSMMNMMVGVEMGGGSILLWREREDGVQGREIKLEDEDEDAFETKTRVAVEDAKAHRLQDGAEPRWESPWESPEAWLVQSNSIDEASDEVE
jgi:hypothetical protein